ncbi:MAG TPA: GNAT family N-acetyltransferase [Candidatus Sulfotelmatobacter sp.]|nr:GNAT family N-acetyltransferase [Candidatus Sulfotelmatobacter sp.]
MPPATIKIRPAAPSDADAIAACLLEAFAPYRSTYTPGAFADTVPTSAQVQLRLQQMRVLVAIAAGKIVGTISATIHGEQGHLRGMAVLPGWQSKDGRSKDGRSTGTAAALLAAIEAWLRSRGCTEVSLDTTEPLTRAIVFYQKHGYRRAGNVSDFFGMPLIEYIKRL